MKQIINKYSLNPKVEYTFINKKAEEEVGVLASFPSKEFFNNKRKQFNKDSLSLLDLVINLRAQKITANAISMFVNRICGVKICKNPAQENYIVKNLGKRYISGYISMLSFHRIQG